ncbi:MAG: iron-sulfur cluster assembly scaffold protein [Candidatus Nealsonbacteria bacterium CG10_big_fil_rev_8_21_14_0_10_36_24]|uniref:Iron-sulfur cluster assembly scaffold protein n=2 Tax=Candidatus Nealsoniibacteriota TaxID=1817911 RepID=A0A2H0YN33_9BACT|nr:MAG: iron-sulfur cluster assembly scaffold protein [Candidatus Nealsonbacteria bacterium CG10_big_fil_rev_8_21_14_0_10_36_24]PIS39917.1 MAG: iron-sulfur cluster assembly scaffold protein [Candidatus Nealsonbacteria bacterium CG08_land_8_20_14_0_20_36_22]
MVNNIYSKKVISHFRNPHNYGKMKNPSAVGKVGNILCGDVMYLYIKVGENDIIKDIKFETFGCVAAISTSSVVTDLAKGKTLGEALKIDSKEIVKSLGGLPSIKYHCSLLGADALSEAIYDYLSKNKRLIPKELQKRHERIEKEKVDLKINN